MKISKTHQHFADELNSQRALENPEEFLGPNCKDVLNFWLYLDTLSDEQCIMARRRFWNLDNADRISSWELAWGASCDVTSRNNTDAVFVPTAIFHIGSATRELIGAHKILDQGKSLTFVPIFLNL
jgi:hypothetical protein